MERHPPVNFILADARLALIGSVLAGFDTGMILLDVAAITEDREQAQRYINSAITALRRADRFFARLQLQGVNMAVARQHREKLLRRLRTITSLPWASSAEEWPAAVQTKTSRHREAVTADIR